MPKAPRELAGAMKLEPGIVRAAVGTRKFEGSIEALSVSGSLGSSGEQKATIS